MERSLERDSMTIDSQVSLVSKVWFLCETSQAPVRLLLPDEKEIPYYLDKSTKFSTKRWELSSVDSINTTQLTDSKCSPRRRKIKLSSLLPSVRRTVGKELRIEEALLKPYRESEEAKQELLLKYASKPKSTMKIPHFELQPPRQLKAKLSPRVTNQLESSQRSIPTAMKGIQCSVSIKEQSIAELNTNDAGYSHASEVKKMLWCTIVSTLIAFQNATLRVQKMRRIRNLDIRKWNAALVIQRNWRYQFYIRKQNYPKSSPSARNKRNKTWHGCYSYKNKHSHHEISRDNIRGRTICEHRGQSCALITRFLVDLRHGPLKMKFCFRGYIKKIKTIQKGLHCHFQANAARVTLLSRHIDRISECIYTHISIVLSERGLDVDLMYPFDVNRLFTAGKNILPSYIMPRILSPMESASFHAFLRKIPVKALSQLQKYFVHLFGSRDIWASSATAANSAPPVGGKFMFPVLPKGYKKALLYDMLFKSRRQHLQSLRSSAKQALALKIPVFDTEDAREFISARRETFDPLSNFLVEALQKNDEVYQTIVTSSKKGEFGGAFGFAPALRILKLMEQVSAEDIVLLLLQLSEQAVKLEQLRRAEDRVPPSSDDAQRGLSRDHNTPLPATGSPMVNFEDISPTSPGGGLGGPSIPPLSRKERGSIATPNSRRKSVFIGDSSDVGMKARPPPVLSPKETSQTFSGRTGRIKGGKQQNQNDIQ